MANSKDNKLKLIVKTIYSPIALGFIISLFLVLKSCNEPIPIFLKSSYFKILFEKFLIGNTLIFNISSGFLVSITFYTILVYLPERQRKKRIKKRLNLQYKYFKKDVLTLFLSVETYPYSDDIIEELMDQDKFRLHFNKKNGDSQNKWQQVVNRLEGKILISLLTEMEIFMTEISLVLNNVDIENEKVFTFFKTLSQQVYRLKNTTNDYDEIKSLGRFLYEVFAGFSFIDGYRKEDIIQSMIDSI
ncbi:hypothetical protein [Maridesulfovibrio ferrireducens]|uniref:hypothetical protein n=1 Tax=Maridesulfovibrio ferrireducens TaxID=246191 RepID=UPI001A231AB5|nr:hypothetical protein [Maridesulfovibrio ferrireducens]MBI9109641.1 hypothetical protein [Maridesulfovibrio ferrireducens]